MNDADFTGTCSQCLAGVLVSGRYCGHCGREISISLNFLSDRLQGEIEALMENWSLDEPETCTEESHRQFALATRLIAETFQKLTGKRLDAFIYCTDCGAKLPEVSEFREVM